MIVDTHVHLYPPEVYETPALWANRKGERYWLSCVQPLNGRSLQGWASVTKLLKDMDDAQVEKAVILAWYWENHDTCEENLNWQIEWTKAHPDRLIGLAPFNAKGKQRAIDLLQLALDAGFKGLGEINPPAQGYDYDDEYLWKALELVGRHQGVASFHVTDPVSKNYPGKIDTPIEMLDLIARRHPSTKFLFAHFGGLMYNENTAPPPENVWFDTAAASLLYDPTVYRKFCDIFGSERLLFGSDYPLRVFPRRESSPDFAGPIEPIANSLLKPAEKEDVLGRNATRLFGLS